MLYLAWPLLLTLAIPAAAQELPPDGDALPADDPAPAPPPAEEPPSAKEPPSAGQAGDEPVVETGPDLDDIDVLVVEGHYEDEPQRGVGDVRVDVQELKAVATPSTEDLLALAPGILVTKPGGDGQVAQIFLRGFDARHGQDIQFTVDGLPLNQVGNPHGHGLVALDFLIPEAVQRMRVQEGVFDPAQGDFAVAGSAEMELGLADPGLLFKVQGGSFDTGRVVAGWRDRRREGTFAIAEVMKTDGYGTNRSAERASALLRFSGGDDERHWHLLGGAHGIVYDHAGLVRSSDVEAGRIDPFGTIDARQGGARDQGFVSAGVDGGDDTLHWSLHSSAAMRGMTVRNNFTGFLSDDVRPGETPHNQRGDLLEQSTSARTFSVRGHVHQELEGLPFDLGLEAGFDGRLDDVDALSERLRALDGAPYRVEQDYSLRQRDVGLYGGVEAERGRLALRAGTRVESLGYVLHDHCAAKDEWFPGAAPDSSNCAEVDRSGARVGDQTRVASGVGVAPRASLGFEVRPNHLLALGAGRGLRSVEALALSSGESAPFGTVWSGEAGWQHTRSNEQVYAVQRAAVFGTQVQRDMLFDEERGANVYAGETLRGGVMVDSELRRGPFTQRSHLTFTHAVFGQDLPPSYTDFHSDRQPGLLVPYVPRWVGGTDLTLRWQRLGLELRHGVAGRFISRRPLPQGEWSSAVFVVDAMTELARGPVALGLSVTNVLDRSYALAEYNFASWSPSTSGTDFPTRTPDRHVSPGAPRALLVTVTLTPDRPVQRRAQEAL